MTGTTINSHIIPNQINGLEIAVIGMAGRFPGAPTVDIFWQNLRNGVESISFFSNEELRAEGISTEYLNNPKFIKAKGVLDNIEWFDASFFGYTPREAQIMDPQQRIFLECAVEALENAGYNSDFHKGLIGVYAGAGMNTYLLKNLYTNPELIESVGDFETMIGNDKDYLTTRVSYKLNLEGPSVAVQTACSTSLVAVCMACQSLLSGECDMVLAGGVSINLPQKAGYLYQEGGMLSPDGHCRAFDAKAQGTAFSSAAGIVVLKRLEDALHDNDHIHAVIKGSALNNDGSFKIGFTAPRVDGQAKAIKAAQIMAEIDPSTISYIEAHGTGTPLGDPIEIAALKQVFEEESDKKEYCAIGSVKSNVGHADAAAGISGLIKTVLMLKHKEIPPSLHFETPNPKIDIENSPFYVNNELRPWSVDGYPRRAGVSSFGIGGTNAHVVLEEAPQTEQSQPPRPYQLLLLSAKSDAALNTMTANLSEHLKQHADINIDDVAYTLQVGRKVYPHRRMVVCRGRQDAITALDNPNQKRLVDAVQEQVKRKPVFMFSGQGAQYVDMGATLYRDEPLFREPVDRCARILEPLLGLDLRTILYPDEGDRETASQQLIQTSTAQVALFVVEYALATLWMALGVRPSAMVGHSIGEYVAACLAGVFSLEDCLSIVVARGRMMQQRPLGSMLAVALSEQDLKPFLNDDISLAAVNGPALCVVSAENEVIESLVERLTKKEIPCRPLHTSHAFHSHMMTPIMEDFTSHLNKIQLSKPNIPFISNVTGNWITADEATDPSYWARHLRQTVRFADGMRELSKDADRVFLEVGPGNTLCTFARQYLEKSAQHLVVSSLRHPKEQKSDTAVILDSIGRLWMAGIQLDWPAFHANVNRGRIPLPAYPFERQRHWVEPRKVNPPRKIQKTQAKKIPDPMQWFYMPAWEKVEKSQIESTGPEKMHLRWLFFMDQEGLGHQLLKKLSKEGKETATVTFGERFLQTSDNEFEINPGNQDDYIELVRRLKAKNFFPDEVVHLWSFNKDTQQSGSDYFEHMQFMGYYSLLYLCKALDSQNVTDPISIQVIANGVNRVVESDKLVPEKSTILAPCKVIPQEHANILCRFIDVKLDENNASSFDQLADQVFLELTAKSQDPMVAYRDGLRCLPTYDRLSLNQDSVNRKGNLPLKLKRHGVYLITGGLGNVGMVIADYLASSAQARIALTGRSEFPPQDEWKNWIANHDESDIISRKIHKLESLKEKGADVLLIKADISNEGEMKAALDKIDSHFGQLHGVIHAAGIVDPSGFRFINELDRNDSERHFSPKVYGLYVLQNILKGKQLDFCKVVSSVASILGGLGYSAYTAANIFMDTFVEKHRKIEPIPWMSVNWDAWIFDNNQKGIGASIVDLGITPEEGHAVLHTILSQDKESQLIVSTSDLEDRIRQWIKLEAIHGNRDVSSENASFIPAPVDSKADNASAMDHVERELTTIWQKLLGVNHISIDDDFFELGGSSLTALRLFTEIEKIFGKKISLASLLKASTVEQLAMIVKEDNSSTGWNSLVTFRDEGSNPPIFLIHGAEGNILLYRELAHHLGFSQPVYGLQSQGLDGREIKHTRIEEIAAHYISEIRTLQSEGPYYLGGYCMGGVVAYEMAQQLFAQGQQVKLLAMFETYNPQLVFNPTSPFKRFYYSLQNVSFHIQNFQKLSARDKSKFFFKKAIVELGRIKAIIIAGFFKTVNLLSFRRKNTHSSISIKKVNDQAYYNYEPKAYPGRLTLFKPQKFFSGADDPHFGWNGLAKDGFDVFELPVNPKGMLVEPFVQKLAEELTSCIQNN